MTSSITPLYEALSLLGSQAEWVEINQEEQIPIDQVIAVPWRQDRLEDCRNLLRQGRTPPPINASRYRIGQAVYYLLSDGNHRTVAAKEAGHTTITAFVQGECICDVSLYVIEASTKRLWMLSNSNSETYVLINRNPLSAEVITSLERVGIRKVVDL